MLSEIQLLTDLTAAIKRIHGNSSIPAATC